MEKFTFGLKITPKTVGDFSITDPTEWTLLIKPQIKDDTLFMHLECMFKGKVRPEDLANGVTEPPMVIRMNEGFMKDGQFVLVNSRTHQSVNPANLLAFYEDRMKALLDLGYMKHTEMYLGTSDPSEPVYRSPRGNTVNLPGMVNTPNFNMVQVGPANNPPKNPHIKLKTIMLNSPNTNQNP